MKESYAVQKIDRRIGDRIRSLREKRGWTQRDLANTAGYSQSTVARWESAERSVRPYNLEKIAEALGIGMQELLLESAVFSLEPAGVKESIKSREKSSDYAAKNHGQENIVSALIRIEDSLMEHGKLLRLIAQDASQLRKLVSQKDKRNSRIDS